MKPRRRPLGRILTPPLALILASCEPELRVQVVEDAPGGVVIERSEWLGPLRHGRFRRFFPSGVLKEDCGWDHGVPEGSWSFRFEDGTPRVEGNYLGGVRHGGWREWREGGLPALEGRYEGGDRVGDWKIYDAQGRLEWIEEWSAGTRIRIRKPDERGE